MKAAQQGFNPTYHQDAPTLDQLNDIDGYAVIEFGTPLCGYCRAAEPAIKQVLSNSNLPHIKVIDGKGKALGRSFKVKLWPTLILLHAGNEVARLVRPVQAEQVQELVDCAL